MRALSQPNLGPLEPLVPNVVVVDPKWEAGYLIIDGVSHVRLTINHPMFGTLHHLISRESAMNMVKVMTELTERGTPQ